MSHNLEEKLSNSIINIPINPEINPWIHTIPESQQEAYINKLLSIGHQVVSCSKFCFEPQQKLLQPIQAQVNNLMHEIQSQNQDSMHNFNSHLEVFKERIDSQQLCFRQELQHHQARNQEMNGELTNSLNQLLGKKSVSSFIGKMGENFIQNLLKHNFPDDTITIKAQSAHEADIHLCDHNTSILIESKKYKTTVSSKEIQKFKEDLKRTGNKFGIFASLDTSITGHKRLEIENWEECVIVYIPHASQNQGWNIVYAVLLCKQLQQFFHKTQLNAINFDEQYEVIQNAVFNLKKVWEELSRYMYDIDTGRKHMIQILNQQLEKTLEFKYRIKEIVDQVSKKILSELNKVQKKIKLYEIEEVSEILQHLKETMPKIYPKMLLLVETLQQTNKKLAKKSEETTDKLLILDNTQTNPEKIIGKIKLYKNKVIVEFTQKYISIEVHNNSIKYLQQILKSKY